MALFKAKQLPKPLVIRALIAFAAISLLGIAFGQTAPGSPIVSDVPVAGGTERCLFSELREPAPSSSCWPVATASSASTAGAASTGSAQTSGADVRSMGCARICRGSAGRAQRNLSDGPTPSPGLCRCHQQGDRFGPLSRHPARLADRHECGHDSSRQRRGASRVEGMGSRARFIGDPHRARRRDNLRC